MTDLLLALAAYALGNIPSAYLFTRLLTGRDIRRIGSGNIGGMNALRHGNLTAGMLTIAADLGKGALAVYLAGAFGNRSWLPLAAAVLVSLGHNYQLAFGGKSGGKGLAAAFGSLLVLFPAGAVGLLLLNILLALLLRDTNAASALAFCSLPLVLGIGTGGGLAVVAGAVWSAIIVSKHRYDLQAYRQGRRKLL